MKKIVYMVKIIALITVILLGNAYSSYEKAEYNNITKIPSIEITDNEKMAEIETFQSQGQTVEVVTTTQEQEQEQEQEQDTDSIENDSLNIEYETPDNSGAFKSYTNYRLLSKNSPQWNKIQCDENAYTDENGLRKVGEYYCVAMGSYYTDTLGDLFEITTEGGTFKVIICDFKADHDTDAKNQYTSANRCMTEFYVDTGSLNKTAKLMGDISYIDESFEGVIVEVNKIGNYFAE